MELDAETRKTVLSVWRRSNENVLEICGVNPAELNYLTKRDNR